jgi:hypothetical protein
MDGFSKEVLSRLPLADGTLSLLSWVLDPEFLDEVFEKHRGRSYQSELSFPVMVSLIQDALLEHHGSAHQAMKRSDELNVSYQAAYGKLRRVPISLSLGFFAETTDRLRDVFPGGAGVSLPASLRAFDVIAVDGKKIKGAAKRLKPARGYSGTPLGGKGLAALDLRKGLMIAFHAHPDGEKNDAPLIPDLLPQVRQRLTRRRLWVADRQFCDLRQPVLFAEGQDTYLIRFHPKNSFQRAKDQPIRKGVDSQGRRYREEWGWLGKAKNNRLFVRRITLSRPGEDDVVLITNLLDADQYPAADLLTVYLARWGIERVFQQVSEVFHLRQLISSSPEGTIFQFGFCMLLYNLIQVVRVFIAEAQRKAAETISLEELFYDVHRELISLSTLVDSPEVVDHFQPAETAAALKTHLRKLFASVWEDRWLKSPKKSVPKSTQPKKPINGGHTSIYRILRAAKRNVAKDV